MSQLRVKTQPPPLANRLAVLIGGDVLVLLLFIWFGRGSHNFPITDVMGGLFAAAPFIISWFLIAPWFGLFRAEVSQVWRKLVPRLLLAWLICGPLAAVLRALFLGRPLPGGIIPIFVLVTTVVGCLLMLAWRLAYLWGANRRLHQAEDANRLRA